jgi:hypothetical protein
MKKFVQNRKIIFLVLINLFVFTSIAFATKRRGLLTDWPASPTGRTLHLESTITDLVAYIYEWGIALGGLIAFIALLIAGFNYLTAVGDPTKMKEAIDRIKYALGGLALLLGSWLILHNINPELTKFHVPEFRFPQTVRRCNTRYDCPEPPRQTPPLLRVCVGDLDPNDPKKEGVCSIVVGKIDSPPCTHAVVYKEIDFRTPFDPVGVILPGTSKKWKHPLSVRFLRRHNPDIDPENIKSFTRLGKQIRGGAYVDASNGCMLRLEKPGGLLGWGCGGPVGMITHSTPNIKRHVQGEVRCISLFPITR